MDKLTYIAVPLWQGAEKRGVELAPQAFIEAGIEDILRQYYDVSFIQMPKITKDIDTCNKYALLARHMSQLKDVVADTFARGALPFTVGGDHALGLGTVAAASERYDNLGVIWFDAHGDINTEATSHTDHIHGMPLAALMGLCSSELNNVARRPLKPENIFWIGTRSLDEGEKQLVDKLNLHVYTTDYVQSVGMQQVMTDVRAVIEKRNIHHLHCSIDVDAMDPSIVPATGVAESNGLNNSEYEMFVRLLPQLPIALSSLDFVEYNPLMDDSEKHSLQWCLNAINILARGLVKK